MIKEDRIKFLLQKVSEASGRSWGSGQHAQVKYIQRQLDKIEHLLQEPEPESLASSVLRLTDLCNRLEAENYELNLKLTQYQAGWCPHDCATVEELAILRERLSFAEVSLKVCRAAEGMLKHKLTEADSNLDAAEKYAAKLKATCSKVMTDAEVMKLRASNVMLLRRNKKLEQDLSLTDTHIEELQEDIELLKDERYMWQILQGDPQ